MKKAIIQIKTDLLIKCWLQYPTVKATEGVTPPPAAMLPGCGAP